MKQNPEYKEPGSFEAWEVAFRKGWLEAKKCVPTEQEFRWAKLRRKGARHLDLRRVRNAGRRVAAPAEATDAGGVVTSHGDAAFEGISGAAPAPDAHVDRAGGVVTSHGDAAFEGISGAESAPDADVTLAGGVVTFPEDEALAAGGLGWWAPAGGWMYYAPYGLYGVDSSFHQDVALAAGGLGWWAPPGGWMYYAPFGLYGVDPSSLPASPCTVWCHGPW